jgi:signal peptidase I
MDSSFTGESTKTFDLSSPQVVTILRDLLDNNVSVRIRVTGQSMQPFLLGGVVVLIKPASPNILRRGDIILYTDTENQPIMHRIVRMRYSKKGTQQFQTKGDANVILDQLINSQQILGRVESIHIQQSQNPDAYNCYELNHPWQRIKANFIVWRGLARYYLHRLRLLFTACTLP